MNAPGTVTLLTDFGPGSVYVGQMHGVLLRCAPQVRIVDLAHDCPFANIEAGGYILLRSYRHFPEGSVHVAVVDPGVGSDRAILAVRAHGHVFLAPNNGLLGPILAGDAAHEARRLENRSLMNEHISSTFHGRDVFAPVAAALATGTPLEEVGPIAKPELADLGPRHTDSAIDGRVLIVDRFGNLITNIPRRALEDLATPDAIRVRIGPAFIDGIVQTFSDVPRGVALVYIGSGDHLEIAVNGAGAADVLGLGVGADIRVERA